MKERKDWAKVFIAALIGTLLTSFISGGFSQNRKIHNSASKEDLKKAKIEMAGYTDRAILECKKDTKEMVKAIDDVHSATVDGIKTDIKDLKEGQATILDYILNQNKN